MVIQKETISEFVTGSTGSTMPSSGSGSNQPSFAGSTQPSCAGSTQPSLAGSTLSAGAGSTQPSRAGSTQTSRAGSTQPSRAGFTSSAGAGSSSSSVTPDTADVESYFSKKSNANKKKMRVSTTFMCSPYLSSVPAVAPTSEGCQRNQSSGGSDNERPYTIPEVAYH